MAPGVSWGMRESNVESDGMGDGFPPCLRCDSGNLVPLSDFGGQGAAVHWKAWVCTNPSCGYNVKIRNGEIYIDEPILSGANRSR